MKKQNKMAQDLPATDSLIEDLTAIKSDLAVIKATCVTRDDLYATREDFQKQLHAQTKWLIGTLVALVSLTLAAVKFLL